MHVVCMYVCMYVCMHACIDCEQVCMYVCVYKCICLCIYVSLHLCICVRMHVWMYVCMDACMYDCIHVCQVFRNVHYLKTHSFIYVVMHVLVYWIIYMGSGAKHISSKMDGPKTERLKSWNSHPANRKNMITYQQVKWISNCSGPVGPR